MSAKHLTKERVAQLVAAIAEAGKTARTVDPEKKFSYPGMCGCLNSLLTSLVHDLAGNDAGDQVRVALTAAYKREGGAA